MTRFLTIVVASLIVMVALSSAQAPSKPVNFYLGVGGSKPTGWLNDPYDLGYHGMGKMGYRVTSKLELRGGLSYHGLPFDFPVDGGDFYALLVGLDLRINMRNKPSNVGPILSGGVGLCAWKITQQGSGENMRWPDISDTDPYFEVGLALESGRGFVQVGYVFIATEGETTKFVPVTVGFRI